jgi:glutathione S-transferase
MSLKLYIGNKNYSSWSMRPWVMLTQAAISFEEVNVRFDGFDDDSEFKKAMTKVAPTGKVPVLKDGSLVIWDTLAISEYVAEKFPEKNLWPSAVDKRAIARSVCAEMHSGFGHLRSHCPMNIEADLSHIGALVIRDKPGVASDLKRICDMWAELLSKHKGPMLLGEFSIADAYFAPVCMRISRYNLPVPAEISAYIARVEQLGSVQAWIEAALKENDFRDFEEPYRLDRGE